jgi:hypothetical protein
MIDSSEAAVGPTRARPAKKSRIPPTVLTSTIARSQPQAAGPTARSRPPVNPATTEQLTHAPRQMRATSGTGGTSATTRSPTRM